jgi:hypothetical protein
MINNCFEREKHVIDCHDDFSDPLCMLNYPLMLVPNDDMQRHAFICYGLMIYKMPIHRKKVILCYRFYALCCSLSCFSLNIILIELRTPWDPGKKCMEHFARNKEVNEELPS